MIATRLFFVMWICLFCAASGWAQQTELKGLCQKAEQLLDQGTYAEATRVATQCLEAAKKVYGPGQPDIIGPLMISALAQMASGKFSEAESYCSEALAIAEKYRPEHPERVGILKIRLWIYEEQGKYVDAETTAKRVIAIVEASRAPDHPDVALETSLLARAYAGQKRYSEAESLYKKALAMWLKSGGADRRMQASFQRQLADVYREQEKYSEAEHLYKGSIEILKNNPTPELAEALNSVAKLYMAQGKHSEAELQYKASLDVAEKVAGFGSHFAANYLAGKKRKDLAEFYSAQGRSDEARKILEETQSIASKKAAGEPDRSPSEPKKASESSESDKRIQLQKLQQKADKLLEEGKYDEAIASAKSALEEAEKSPDKHGANVAKLLLTLGDVYTKQKKYAEAENFLKRSLEIREDGDSFNDLVIGLLSLTTVYEEQGKYAQAELLAERNLALHKAKLGPDDPWVNSLTKTLARIYKEQGKNREAHQLLKEARLIPNEASAEPPARSASTPEKKSPSPLVTIHEMKVKPSIVKGGDEVTFSYRYTVKEPQGGKGKVPVAISYSLRQNGAIISERPPAKYEVEKGKERHGEKTIGAPQKSGSYELGVRIQLHEAIVEKFAPLRVQ